MNYENFNIFYHVNLKTYWWKTHIKTTIQHTHRDKYFWYICISTIKFCQKISFFACFFTVIFIIILFSCYFFISSVSMLLSINQKHMRFNLSFGKKNKCNEFFALYLFSFIFLSLVFCVAFDLSLLCRVSDYNFDLNLNKSIRNQS